MASLQAIAQEAHTLSGQGKHVEAAAKYDEILKMNEGIAEVHLNKGVSLSNAGDKQGALAAFTRASELKPDLLAAFSNMANILKGQGKHKEAVAAYQKATDLDPSIPSNWSNLAHELSELGDFDAAIDAATRGIENNKGATHIPTHNERIFAHFKNGNPQNAVDDVEAIIAATPLSDLDDGQRQLYCMILAQAGSKFMEEGDLDKAEYFLEMACENDPSVDNLLVYGVCLIQKEKDEAAMDILSKARKIDPNHWKVIVALGTVHIKNQNFEEAVGLFKNAMEFAESKKDSNVNFNYAIALMNLGRDSEAKEPLEYVVKMEPDNWVALSLLGSIYLGEKDFAKAAKTFEKASKIPGADADSSLFYNFGYANLMQNKPNEALKAFEKAVEINPDSEQAQAAIKALKTDGKIMTDDEIAEAIEIAAEAKKESKQPEKPNKKVSFTEEMEEAVRKTRNPIEMAQVVLVPQKPQFGLDPHEQGSSGYVMRTTKLFEQLNANVAAEKEVMRKPSVRRSLKNPFAKK